LAVVLTAVTLCVAIDTVGVEMVSLAVKFSVMIFPVFACAVLVLFDTIVTAESTGAVLSNTMLLLLVVAVTVVPALPVTSLNAMLNGTFPSASAPVMVYDAVQALAVVLIAVTLCVAINTVGAEMVSLPVKFSVMIFPVFARAVLVLFDTIATAESTGAVLSNTMLLLLVVAITVVPALPVTSLNAMLNGTFPSASAPVMV
jgi:hypothetical protein